MPARKKNITFDEYKTVKDEIIKISEERFENLLTRRLKEFKNELMNDLKPRFDAIDAKFQAIDTKFQAIDTKFQAIESRFDSLEKRLGFITWFLPVFIGLIVLVLKFVKV